MKIVNTSRFLSLDQVFTGRNEVVAKVMFLHVSVILSTGGVSRQGEPPPPGQGAPRTKGEPPRTRQTPPDQGEPPRDRENPPGPRENPPDQGEPPDQADTPQTRETPPPTPPREADSRILSTSGRYASYWNAFLFVFIFPFQKSLSSL